MDTKTCQCVTASALRKFRRISATPEALNRQCATLCEPSGTYVHSARLIENLMPSRLFSVLSTRAAQRSYVYEAHTHTHTFTRAILWSLMSDSQSAILFFDACSNSRLVQWDGPIVSRDLENPQF